MNLLTILRSINRQHGQYFFEPDSMRFFRSRVSDWSVTDGNKIYFVTSEQFHNSMTGYTAPRLYSARVMDKTTGQVSYVADSGFQDFKSGQTAKAFIKRTLSN